MINGRPKITWFKDNYNISNNRYMASEDYGGIRRLHIRDPVPSDFGCYTCRAEENHHINEISLRIECATYAKVMKTPPARLVNTNGDDQSYRARSRRSQSKFADKAISRRSESHQPAEETLYRDAKRRPIFSTRLMDRTAAENSSIKLTCQIMGVDMYTEWYRYGSRLENNPRYATRLVDGLATLEIFSCRPSDSGEYTCTVRNSFGESSCSAHFKVFAGHEKRPMMPIFTRSMKGSIPYPGKPPSIHPSIYCIMST